MPLRKVGNINTGTGGLKKVGNINSGIIPQKVPQGVNRETLQRAQNIQKPTGASGLYENFKTDFGSFAKGIVGLGRQAVTHPIDTGGKVLGIGAELVKGVPEGAKLMAQQYAHPVDTWNKGVESIKQLRQIPLDEQKRALGEMMQKIGQSPEAQANPDKRRMAQLGLALMGNYTQYSRPGEKIYNEPFSFALDAIPVAKAAGAGKLASKGAEYAKRIPVVQKAGEVASDMFVPGSKLKRMGYANVAEDLQKTGTNMRQAQEGIIKSTVKQFKDLSKQERGDFFDAIDSLRRTPDVYPTHPNPKVQAKIDWYMKEELPRIRKVAGYDQVTAKLDPMSQEARKYKSAEEFAKSKQYNVKAYRFNKGKKGGDVEFFSREKDYAESYQEELATRGVKGEIISENIELKNPLIVNASNKQFSDNVFEKPYIDKAIKEGYDGVLFRNKGDEFVVKIKQNKESAKSKLTDIWNQASKSQNNAPIQNYLHHFFNPTNETKFGGKLSSPQRGFLKQSKDVEGFVKDPVVSIAGVKSKAATANIKDAFVQRIATKYAKPADTVTEFKNGTILEKGTGQPLIKWKGQYLPKDLGDELLRYEGKGNSMVDKMLTPLKVFNRNWKPLATAVRPRYHLRNIVGNMYNASFVGNANPKHYFTALGEQMKGHIATQMKEGTVAGQVYKALFKKPPEHKYIKMATEDGVVGRGFFAADINDLADIANNAEDFGKAIAKMENPAEIYRVPVLRQWLQASSSIGQGFEDNARLALYIDQLKKGASRKVATAYVNKHLFDYINGLGEGDMALKAIIPFWSWTRFNVPLQYGALWKNPIRNVVAQEFGKPYVQQNEQNNPEYQYLSQREKDMGALKVGETTKDGKTYDKYVRTQGVLPIQDIGKVLDPENAGLSPAFSMVEQGYRRFVSPDSPQENLDYFGRPVENYPGEVKRYMGLPVRGTTREFLNSIPALSEINKGFGGSYTPDARPDASIRRENVFSPLSVTLQDREQNQKYYYGDLNRKLGGSYAPGFETEFKYVVKNLIERPKDSVANENFKTLTELLRQNGFSDQDISKSVKEAILSFKKSDKYKTMEKENLYKNIEEVQRIPYYK